MKVARWVVFVAVSFMALAAGLDFLWDIVTNGNLEALRAVGNVVMVVNVVALLRMQKAWIITALFSNLFLLVAHTELTMEYAKIHSIALTIIVAALIFLGLALKNRQVLQ